MSDKTIPGVTLMGSDVLAESVEINKLVIDGRAVNKITHDSTNTQFDTIPSSIALREGLDSLGDEIKKIDPNNNFLLDNTVITLALISPTITNDFDEWDVDSWICQDGTATYVGKNFEQDNYIGIDSKDITSSGTYFFIISIPRLDSGRLILVDENDITLETITSYGTYPIEVHVNNADVATFKFKAVGVFVNEVIVVNTILFHRITPRLKSYLDFKLTGSASGQPITTQEMTNAINSAIDTNITPIHNTIINITTELSTHTSDVSNPHEVTADQINAAHKIHTHTPTECGAAPLVHSHTVSNITDIDTITDRITTLELNSNTNTATATLSAHLIDHNNPHQVTATQVGAAPTNHTHSLSSLGAAASVHSHIPTECGAAAIVHTHFPSDCGAAPLTHTHTPDSIGAATASHTHTPESIGAALAQHSHAEYMTASQVLNKIVTSHLLDANIPFIITSCDNGESFKYPGVRFTNPCIPINTNKLIHRANTRYDWFDGYANQNVQIDTGDNGTRYFFKAHTSARDVLNDTPILTVSDGLPILTTPAIITYTFHKPRVLNGLKIYKNATNNYGNIVAFKIYVDETLVSTINDATWFVSNNFINIPFTATEGKVIKVVVTQVTLNANYKYAFRTEISFADVADNTLSLFNSIGINTWFRNSLKNLILTDIPDLVLSSTPTDTKQYVYLSLVDNGGTTPDATLETTFIPPVCGSVYEGSPALIGNYVGKINSIFGTLSVTNEVPMTNPVENIYQDDDSYWLTANGVTSATITHTFVTGQDLTGIKLIFTSALYNANYVPDKIVVIVTDITNTTTTVLDITNYSSTLPYGELSKIFDDVMIGIKTITCTLTGTKNQTAVGLCQFVPLFDCIFYNTETGHIGDDTVFPLGYVEMVSEYSGTWVAPKFTGLPFGNYYHVPVTSMESYIGTIVMDNLFGTELVTVEFFSHNGKTMTKQLLPHSVSDKLITLVNTSITDPISMKVTRH